MRRLIASIPVLLIAILILAPSFAKAEGGCGSDSSHLDGWNYGGSDPLETQCLNSGGVCYDSARNPFKCFTEFGNCVLPNSQVNPTYGVTGDDIIASEASAGGYTASDFTPAFVVLNGNDLSVIATCQGNALIASYFGGYGTVEYSSAGICQGAIPTCQVGGSPINGTCGSSNGGTFGSAPTSNLCGAGNGVATPAPSGSGPWSWTCGGSNGGSASATCSASQGSVNGMCGSADGVAAPSAPSSNLCSAGTASAVSGSGPWSWTCNGANGGSDMSCSAPSSAGVNGTCGIAHNAIYGTYSTPGSGDMCATGTATSVGSMGQDGVLTWTCSGSGGGSNANCSTQSMCGSLHGGTYDSRQLPPISDRCKPVALLDELFGGSFFEMNTSPWSWWCRKADTWSEVHTCSYVQGGGVVNGQCGTPATIGHEGIVMSANVYQRKPSTGLCIKGNTGQPTRASASSPWTWTCSGSGGGANASCSSSHLPGITTGIPNPSSGDIEVCFDATCGTLDATNWYCSTVNNPTYGDMTYCHYSSSPPSVSGYSVTYYPMPKKFAGAPSSWSDVTLKYKLRDSTGIVIKTVERTFPVNDHRWEVGFPDGDISPSSKPRIIYQNNSSRYIVSQDPNAIHSLLWDTGGSDGVSLAFTIYGSFPPPPPPASDCTSQTKNWTVSGTNCSGTIAAVNHGASGTATDSTTPDTGTATYSCNNGTLTIQSGATCDPTLAGVCGTANGVSSPTAPSTNLCSIGTPSSVTSSSGNWNWTCAGVNGGASASCSAPQSIDGICGPANGSAVYTKPTSGLCAGGNATPVIGAGPFEWNCNGINGGMNVTCSAILIVNGQCGPAQGQYTTTPPTTGLCSAGTETAVAGTGPYAWGCNGINGGSNISCSSDVIVNGACGTASNTPTSSAPSTNLCSTGTPGTVSGGGPWNWDCTGSGGGTKAFCSAPKPPPPPTFGGACPI